MDDESFPRIQIPRGWDIQSGIGGRSWLSIDRFHMTRKLVRRGRNPQTESLRLTERYRRPDFGHLELEVTYDDPKTFTKPFTVPCLIIRRHRNI